jgi:hypothetical protein
MPKYSTLLSPLISVPMMKHPMSTAGAAAKATIAPMHKIVINPKSVIALFMFVILSIRLTNSHLIIFMHLYVFNIMKNCKFFLFFLKPV